MKVACLIVILATVASASLSRLDTIKNKLAPRPSIEITPFIINADKAAENSAPYMVSFSVSNIVYGYWCSGVITSKEWVLAPAHCIEELKKLNGKAEGLHVYAGLTDRSNLTEAQVRKIDFAFNHKGFTGEIGTDDIALIHVTPSFEFNSRVKEISLPSQNDVFDGETAIAYGWGLTDPQGTSYSNELHMAKSTVLTHEKCENMLPKGTVYTEKHVCVAITACYGDGGAPLVIERPGSVVEFIGFVSYGFLPCGHSNRPTVFTKVASYKSWITEVQ